MKSQAIYYREKRKLLLIVSECEKMYIPSEDSDLLVFPCSFWKNNVHNTS